MVNINLKKFSSLSFVQNWSVILLYFNYKNIRYPAIDSNEAVPKTNLIYKNEQSQESNGLTLVYIFDEY